MSNLTDTNQVNELYELCKKVYELTEWDVSIDWSNNDSLDFSHFCYEWDDNGYKTGEKWVQTNYSIHMAGEEEKKICPAYTSDYLLEKLPRYIYLQQSADGKSWGASQLQPTELRTAENAYQSINTSAVTPLRALLLLTLKLHEEGLL